MLEIIVLTIFPGLLIVAAVGDLLTYRIPNWISLALVCLFAISVLVAGLDWMVIAIHAGVAVALLAVGMGLFALKLLGGGDAKLLAAIGLWLGFTPLLPYLFWITVVGGLLAASVLLFRKLSFPTDFSAPAWLARLHNKQEGIPYGIAIAAGALLALPNAIWFGHVTTAF